MKVLLFLASHPTGGVNGIFDLEHGVVYYRRLEPEHYNNILQKFSCEITHDLLVVRLTNSECVPLDLNDWLSLHGYSVEYKKECESDADFSSKRDGGSQMARLYDPHDPWQEWETWIFIE